MSSFKANLPEEFNFVVDKIEIFGNEVYVINNASYLRIVKFFLYLSELELLVEEPFYLFDVFDIIRKYHKWVEYFPRITPFYALKCHPHPIIIQLLASLGTGFDCASISELKQVINYNVVPDRIVYANAVKFEDHLAYADETHIKKMTFDSLEELYKIKDNAPNASLILRVFVETTTARCPLGLKFGAPLDSVPEMVRLAKQLNLNIVGVSFHVGSGCTDADVYRRAIEDSHYVFEFAKSEGIHMKLLDIGGGFPGDFEYDSSNELFLKIADVVNSNIDKYFKEKDGVMIISEPGRFFVASAMQLITKVIDEAPKLKYDPPDIRTYIINDGMHGSLNCVLFDHFIGESFIVRRSELDEVEPSEVFYTYFGTNAHEKPKNFTSQKLYPTTIRGITGEMTDVCVRNELFPEIQIGDIIVFKNMGAYTRAAASRFHGHKIPRTYNYVYLDDLKSIAHFLSEEDRNKLNLSQQKYVAVDCEMIGIGKQGSISFVARVSIVNSKGKVLYDKFVKPDAHVTDYRTEVSGIRPHDLSKGLTFETVQDDVGKIFSISEIVVGHTILNDLNCLKIKLRQSQLRDIAYCSHLKELAQMGSQRVIGLRSLASSLLSMSIQTGEHSSVQDAIATMQLYMLVKDRCTKKCAPKYK